MEPRITEETATHNHMFSIAFTVNSKFADGLDCLKHEHTEVLARLVERTAVIIVEGVAYSEAFGLDDTYEIVSKEDNQ